MEPGPRSQKPPAESSTQPVCEIEWDVQDAGADVMDRFGGNPLPDHVLDSIRRNGTAIKGPITTPVGSGFRSVNVGLRKELDMYAQVRPCKIYPGVRTRYADTPRRPRDRAREHRGSVRRDRVRARLDGRARGRRRDQSACRRAHPRGRRASRSSRSPSPAPAGWCSSPSTTPARNGRQKVTVGAQGEHHEVHRRPVARGVAAGGGGELATSSSTTASSTTCACSSCRSPSCTTCWCCPNLYGDIVSDLGAGLVGGLGVAPGANFGTHGRGVRADPRLGAKVRRAEQGQPDCDDALRCTDAAAPRASATRPTGWRRRSPR